MNFDIYLGADGYWWWRLYDPGGRVIGHATQGHASPDLCRSEIEAVKASAHATVSVSAPTGHGAGSEAL